ncbi:MAG: YjbQ family protein [Candidatus Omnitrophica bacterium]|nr:YjbQ family protein [Candidatus Omnitrophota bacterium]
MKVLTEYLNLSTKGNTDIINITEEIDYKLKDKRLENGIVNISIPGSTAGLTTCEYEPGLVQDLKDIFEKLIPQGRRYAHDNTWGDGNGHSHLRASLLGPSLTVPFNNNSLVLGAWQQIIFIDFDNRPRKRKITLQFIGE